MITRLQPIVTAKPSFRVTTKTIVARPLDFATGLRNGA